MKRLATLALAALAACDWAGSAFLNGIPVQGSADHGDVYVYIGVDGLSLEIVRAAMEQGAFAGPSWSVAKFVTMFPGTSDASWTRILHTKKIPGYEFEYYDPGQDAVKNSGLAGVGRHLMPTVHESLSFEAPYLKSFDYRANGYAHSLEAYRDTWVSLGDTLDTLFFDLEGRAETQSVFTAYILESDVLGHTATPADCTKLLTMLASRIEQFRSSHPRRTFHFTLLSDHGMDFKGIPRDRLVDFHCELPRVGVEAVSSIRGRDPAKGPFAIPIVHTRVTYLSLHTHPDLVEEVARRTSSLESVDFTTGALESGRVGLWSGGKLAASFGYDAKTSEYILTAGGDYARFGVPVTFAAGEREKRIRDEDLFALTKDGQYPDLFYRVRTSLSDVGVDHPADILISFKRGWGSLGFTLPGNLDAFSGGSHGAADDASTFGVLVSDEIQLPDAVRADGFLALFPRVEEHLRWRGVELIAGDADGARTLR